MVCMILMVNLEFGEMGFMYCDLYVSQPSPRGCKFDFDFCFARRHIRFSKKCMHSLY